MVREAFVETGLGRFSHPKTPRVLMVDTLSATNDFGVEVVMAIAPWTQLTVFANRNSKLKGLSGFQLIEGFPEFFGERGKIRKGVAYVGSWVRLLAWAWRFRRDTIHVQFFRSILPEMLLFFILRPWVKTIVYTAHNALPHERRGWHGAAFGMWYRLVDQIHVLSSVTRDLLVQEFGVLPEKIRVFPHGNYQRLTTARPPDASRGRALMGVPRDEVCILFFGLVRKYKGVGRLMRAFALARTHRSHLRLVIAGTGTSEELATIAALSAELSLDGSVTLMPRFLDDQELNDAIAGADITCFPYEHIYQSGALMLAMTIGSAIVASDISGFRDYVDDGRTGLLCDTADGESFAETLEHLARNSRERLRLAEASRDEAASRFDWARIGKHMCEGYCHGT